MNYQDLPLRGMQIPEAIGLWPLAPGWYFLIFLACLLPFCIIEYKKHKAKKLMAISISHLNQVVECYKENKDSIRLAEDISQLLRKIVISQYPRERTASVIGFQWLLLLDQLGGNNQFSQGFGLQLLEAPYRNMPLENPEELIELTSNWIRHATKKPIKGGL